MHALAGMPSARRERPPRPGRWSARRLGVLVGVGAALVALVGGCAVFEPATPSPVSDEVAGVGLHVAVDRVVGGLEHPWDIGFLPDGRALVTERPGRLVLLDSGRPGARADAVAADFSDVLVKGEGGLLGLLVHPDFAATGRFTTCQTHQVGGRAVDIRLVTWRLSTDGREATRERVLLSGLPVADGGRHSGWRLALDPTGALLVGTGDTARGSVPQDRTSLGGKVLRVSLTTGEGLPDNPFAGSADANERRVLSDGHRNVQGIAVDPTSGAIVTAEHGPSVDDEVNVIRPGGNYGWDPSRGGESTAYDESVPMTDRTRFPDAVDALWSTGSPTQALCGLALLPESAWPGHGGDVVVTSLKGARVFLVERQPDGSLGGVQVIPETDQAFGRLRAAVIGPDGALYVTTSNGDDDQVLRLTPR